MRNAVRLGALALVLSLFAASPVLACHSTYFNEMFTKIMKMREGGNLQKNQIASLWKLNDQFKKTQALYNRQGRPSSALDPHVETFVAAAAGVLDSDQFKSVTGKKKTEVQELRFEVNQLRAEIAEIKALLEQLSKKVDK